MKYIVRIDMFYNMVPTERSPEPYEIRKIRCSVNDTIDDAVEDGNMILGLLEKCGYEKQYTFEKKNDGSIPERVQCTAKGCYCFVIIEQLPITSITAIAVMAKKSIEESKKYTNWLLNNDESNKPE